MDKNVIQCSSCGATISKNGKFCEYCGARLFLDEEASKVVENGSSAEAGATAMVVMDVFSIMGRGTVVTGRAENTIKVGDKVRNTRTNETLEIKGIEMFRKVCQNAEKGQNCGLLISTDRNSISRGDTLIFD